MQVRVEWKWKAGSCRRQTGCSTCKFSRQAAIGVHRHLPTTKLGGMWVSLQLMLSRIPPGVEQAPKGHYQLLRWNWGTPKPFDLPWWDAKMLAYGTEGGGGVVAQGLAVMARTR